VIRSRSRHGRRMKGEAQPAGTAPGAPAPPSPAPSLKWSWLRGPAAVTFDPFNPRPDRAADGRNTTTAAFTAPGPILRLQANDSTGEGRRIPVLLDQRVRKGHGQGAVITTAVKPAATPSRQRRPLGPQVQRRRRVRRRLGAHQHAAARWT
jgi:hypothetical protein